MALAIYWRGALGLRFSLAVAVAGHILLALPFVILTMNASVSNFRYSLLEAARDLGASPLQTFRDILFPIIRPAIEGSALLAIAISLDEFIVTLFVGGRDTTLATAHLGAHPAKCRPKSECLSHISLVRHHTLSVPSSSTNY